MSVISYREIFDAVSNYTTTSRGFKKSPTIIEVAKLAQQYSDDVIAESVNKFKVVVWDKQTQLDQRSVNQFIRDLGITEDNMVFYILDGNTIISLKTQTKDGVPIQDEETLDKESKEELDQITKQFITGRLIDEIVNNLIEKELEKGD